MEKTVVWSEDGREHLELKLDITNNDIQITGMKAIGSLDFLNLSHRYKTDLNGPIDKIVVPTGDTPSEMIWREVILTLKNEWTSPVDIEEICHCRKIMTQVVDRAIVYGAHDVDSVRRKTSANTGCGTCRPDIEKLLEHRKVQN